MVKERHFWCFIEHEDDIILAVEKFTESRGSKLEKVGFKLLGIGKAFLLRQKSRPSQHHIQNNPSVRKQLIRLWGLLTECDL